jgi:hypothetical protein
MSINAIVPNATVEKLEETVLIGLWCSVEAKPLVARWRTQRFGWCLASGELENSTLWLGFGWATQRESCLWHACDTPYIVSLL